MKQGGQGGANTKTGLHFEHKTSLQDALVDLGFIVDGHNHVFSNGNKVATLAKGHNLYKLLTALNGSAIEYDWRQHICRRLLPDEALYVYADKHLHVIEKKWQQTEGSVDEKLQTCHFKLTQYQRLLKPLGISVSLAYVLNDWFSDPKYRDVLDYMRDVGCFYHFNELPLADLGLQIP